MDEWVAGVMQDGNHMSTSSEVTEDWKVFRCSYSIESIPVYMTRKIVVGYLTGSGTRRLCSFEFVPFQVHSLPVMTCKSETRVWYVQWGCHLVLHIISHHNSPFKVVHSETLTLHLCISSLILLFSCSSLGEVLTPLEEGQCFCLKHCASYPSVPHSDEDKIQVPPHRGKA